MAQSFLYYWLLPEIAKASVFFFTVIGRPRKVSTCVHLRGLGQMLILLRIAQEISQHDLAKRPDVHESQVPRDERNEYFSVTLERTSRTLDALNAWLRTKVAIGPNKQKMAVP